MSKPWRTILLTRGQVAYVDTDDYPRLVHYKWHATWDVRTRSYRATRSEYIAQKHGREYRRCRIMAREIMECPPGLLVDHINHDTLDNRRSNLRLADHSTNQINSSKHSGSHHSRYKGVTLARRDRRKPKYFARLMVQGKRLDLGYFDSELEAAAAYDKAAWEHFGEYAHLNLLLIACSWCSSYMGWKDGDGTKGVTHSICRRCAKKLEEDDGEAEQQQEEEAAEGAGGIG